MQRIAVTGAELASLSLGAGSQTPVVMLHGLATGNMATGEPLIVAALTCERRVILYDQRGHGDSSPATTGFDLPQQAQDLAAVLAHHKLSGTAVDLVGHSMGALIALHFALRTPSQVRRLVLVDAPMPAANFVAPSLLALRNQSELQGHIKLLFGNDAKGRGRRQQRLQKRLAALLFDSSMVADVQAMPAESDDALSSFRHPVQLIYGQHSPCISAASHLQKFLPNARTTLFDCGHYVPTDAPDLLRTSIAAFLMAEF